MKKKLISFCKFTVCIIHCTVGPFVTLNFDNTKSILIFNRENLQNFKSQNGLRRGLDFIAWQFDSTALPGFVHDLALNGNTFSKWLHLVKFPKRRVSSFFQLPCAAI